MAEIIRYAVSCTSLYGAISLLIVCLGFIAFAYIIYKTISIALPYVHKILKMHYDTVTKYNDVHTKLGAGDVSMETDLKR